ncbi:MAG: sensor domain-containing diguanylate cyclase [Lachnospiraceae bacterium]|jgi:diguanylate cyclase (GGDEF)-like protein|nr:sensor domain-containing diguanylate cyclase [Lachnospiraceae bacterium]
MDLQKYVDGFGAMTCIVSVEKPQDGRRGKFRIVAGNKAYVESIENPAPGAELLTRKFIPNQEYTKYLTRDLNFEDYCYRAAVEKKCLTSYASPDRMQGIWFNMIFLPVAYEEENLCYCTYTMEINFEANLERLSTLRADVTANVIKICLELKSSKEFHELMNDVIKDIRDMFHAEHCCILLMDSYERKCSVLCEALSENTVLTTMNKYLDDRFYDIAESWSDLIAGSNCLVVKDEQDMQIVKERNPVWYESITSAHGKNIVLFPLKFKGDLLGYIWAINYDIDRAVSIKETFETSAAILASAISNFLLLERLRILSSKDMLTGVMNRNEMNNYVERLSKDTTDPVGVVFADLNGLKRINDRFGHSAGDKLLKNAAKILEEVFETEQIFRAGGDEFTIIITGITEDELDRRVAKIREMADKQEHVSFAIGKSYESNRLNVRKALRIADERMYEDKRLYYEKHPEMKR